MLRKIFAVLLMLAWGSALIYAQGTEAKEADTKKVKGGGGGGFMVGVSQFDLNTLNDKLKAKGFEDLGDNQIFFGGGGYGIINGKILLGGEGGGFSKDVASSTQKASLSGGYGFFDIGYVIFSKSGFNLFPLLGIGGGGFSLRIVERAPSPTFDEILDNPKREANISTGSFLFNFALGLDYLLALGEDKEGRGGLLLGIRAGYIFDPTKADWKMTDQDVLKGPDIRFTGPYVHLVLGGMGASK